MRFARSWRQQQQKQICFASGWAACGADSTIQSSMNMTTMLIQLLQIKAHHFCSQVFVKSIVPCVLHGAGASNNRSRFALLPICSPWPTARNSDQHVAHGSAGSLPIRNGRRHCNSRMWAKTLAGREGSTPAATIS